WGPRPTISSVSKSFRRGGRVAIGTAAAGDIASVVLVRNTALTHLVDGDQRTVQLPIIGRTDTSLTARVPRSRAVLPPGPYLLFINRRTARGLVPSTARQFTLR